MRMRDLFFPKKRDFYKMLLDQAEKTEEGLRALHTFVENQTPENGARVEALEEEADELRKTLILELNESFVTPIDREDIFALSRAVDDMIDYAKSTVEEIRLFKVATNDYLLKMTEALANSAAEIAGAIRVLEARPSEAHDHVVRAKRAENFVEHRYREALAELFESTDVINVLKCREVYRHLSNAADRGDEAADILGDIIIKIT